jgi:hypothetical protein
LVKIITYWFYKFDIIFFWAMTSVLMWAKRKCITSLMVMWKNKCATFLLLPGVLLAMHV